ncbi:MAG: type II toxin-antitoxin system VapC family toxin [Desulfovermiculus sp.]
MKNVLIDTNIYSLAMKGEPNIVDILRRIERIGISTISLGELFSGFKAGSKERQNREELEIFLDSPRVVLHSVDVETADFYSFILNSLRQAGTPIPTNDIWIAATALQHGYKLFSQDKHFDYVHGIMIIRS